jgi:hypothetical protein
MARYHGSNRKHKDPAATRGAGIDTSLFIGVILGLVAIIGLLLQWNGIISVRWAWSLPMYVVLCISAVYAFWRWEAARNWKIATRYSGVFVITIAFVAASSVGVVTQYKRENPPKRDLRAETATWLSHTNWQFKPMDTNDPDFKKFIANTGVFAFGVTFPSGMHLVIFQGAVHPDFLQVKSIVPCSDEDVNKINSLSFDQTNDLFEQIRNKLTGTFVNGKIIYDLFRIPSGPISRPKSELKSVYVTLTEYLATDNLTAEEIGRSGDEIDKAAHFVYTTMDIEIKKASN